MPTTKPQHKATNALLIAGILIIAINLRPALASVGPLIEDIRQATGLSNIYLGLLTSLPLFAFGLISYFAPLVTKRFGIGVTLLAAKIVLTVGILVRSIEWLRQLVAQKQLKRLLKNEVYLLCSCLNRYLYLA